MKRDLQKRSMKRDLQKRPIPDDQRPTQETYPYQ